MKRQKDLTLEDEPPGQKVFSMLLGKSRGQLLIAPERMKQLGCGRQQMGKMTCSGSLTPPFVNNDYVTAKIVYSTAHAHHEVLF